MKFVNRTKQEVLQALEVLYDANRNTKTREQEQKIDLAIDMISFEFGITEDFKRHMDESEGEII